MKNRNIIILFIVSVITLIAIGGLLVYAFELQNRKDPTVISDNSGHDKPTKAPTEANEKPTDEGKVTSKPTPSPTPTISPVVLGFAGDVNLDENSDPVAKYDSSGEDISACFSNDLLKEMQSADVMMLNNEFSYSTRGTKSANKSYTFRADPKRVDILKQMGVDIVSLANNHALDYGPDALQDTFDTLDKAKIDYVGAGENINRAKAPIYRSVGGRKIAFLAASRVIFTGSWYATDNKLGMVGTYDPAMIIASIKEANANSDFVVIFVHWGVERNNYPEAYQRQMARQYIDAGADVVIGCHSHVMQGVEYYKGKPIAYSLGNYWFNSSTKQSGMVKLYLDPNNTIKFQLLPVMNKNTKTYLLTDPGEKKTYYNFMRSLSSNVTIDEDGYVH